MGIQHLRTPIPEDVLPTLKTGDRLMLTGIMYTARDAAHKRMFESLLKGDSLPFDIVGQTLYYVGPTPAKPGEVIGSAGPTTSGRMDKYTPKLLEMGLKVMIGKGKRNEEVKEAIKRHQAVYLAAVGGAGALIARAIKKVEVVAYEDLGTEAIRKLEVENFPVIVANDIYGNDLFELGGNNFESNEKGGRAAVVTETLVHNLLHTSYEDLPSETIEEAKRSLLNWLGVAIGAVDHPSVDMVLKVAQWVGGNEQATILGRGLKTNLLFASLVNGMSSHIFDFDDTLLETVLHPSAPVFPAILAYVETMGLSGKDVLFAFVLGCEVEARLAKCLYPSHIFFTTAILGSAGLSI